MKSEMAGIGIFDSGVGGLSVYTAIRRLLPSHPVIYLADQAHVPYGPRSLAEVRAFSEEITRYLLAQGAQIIVVACNTASAAALHSLRESFPLVPFVGMEPAVKPAAEQTQSGVVGVLATPATFQGILYTSVVERFAKDVNILQNTCNGLVTIIESGQLNSQAARQILEQALTPMLKSGIDTVVLGCTHYPFVIPLIKEIVGEKVQVIDPSPAVAAQVKRILEAHGCINRDTVEGNTEFITTKNPAGFEMFLEKVIRLDGQKVKELRWKDNRLINVSKTGNNDFN